MDIAQASAEIKDQDFNHNEKRDSDNVLRVHVATPAYDGKVDCDFASSMMMAGQVCTLQLIECSAAMLGNGAFIEIARNVLVKEFLESENLKEFTHFAFIDADLRFESRALPGLVRSGLPVTAGAYRKRQDKEEYPIRWVPLPKVDEREPDRLWMNGGWLRCDRIATGFLVIERHVLEVMTEKAIEEGRVWDLPDQGPTPALFYTKTEDGRFIGEDVCWSDDYTRYYKEGLFEEPIWVWTDFDFVHGGYECNYMKWLDEHSDKDYKPGGNRKLGGRHKKEKQA
jgi:hypothetical protein